MSYINFDKTQLVNLEYSLKRELLRSNRAGSYGSTTIPGCNTRRYHGLLVTPQPGIDNGNHVLLSSLDETIIQMEADFNLGLHKYPGGIYNPKGHKYLRDFSIDPYPVLTYRVGGVILTKEMVFTVDDRIIIKYTLVDAHSPTTLRLRPFLAFRSIHSLSKENIWADKKYEKEENGIRVRMYDGYTPLYMQISRENEYTHVPDWFYNIEYQEDMECGYDYQEDLYSPGFFDFRIKKGESVYFAAGTREISPSLMKKSFEAEVRKRTPRNNFTNCLINSAQQFIVRKDEGTHVIAGYPWFGRSGRSTFASLPGLTLIHGDKAACKEVINTMIREMRGPLFPMFGSGDSATWNSADTSLWFFWTVQQYLEFTGERKSAWKSWGGVMKTILEGYRAGTEFNIRMDADGLISALQHNVPLTWMDAMANGKPVTPRQGKTVEVNALWYNAVCMALEMAEEFGDHAFAEKWKPVADMIPVSFQATFWSPEKRYLADYIDGAYKDWAVRPNMVIATSLPYSPVPEEIRKDVLSRVRQELLTPRGLRTLTPKSPVYKGCCTGGPVERETAYHQGSVSPWMLGHFVEGYLKIHGKSGLGMIKKIYAEYEPALTEHGIGCISEIYDGDPPHLGRGAISQASSVAELLRISYLIDKYCL